MNRDELERLLKEEAERAEELEKWLKEEAAKEQEALEKLLRLLEEEPPFDTV